VTVRVLEYRGDGGYYLGDPALELEGVRAGPVARVLCGDADEPVAVAVRRVVGDAGARLAHDVIIAAPKPVSVLLATESDATARRVVALHERAVDAVHDYLVDDADGSRGAARGAVAIGFTHGVSRLLDPHLHTHVLVAGRGAGGEPVEGRSLRRRARSADALYLAALREGLPDATGRVAWAGRRGGTHVEGVDVALVAATSTPRARGGRLERGPAKLRPTRAQVRDRWDALVASCAELGSLEVPTRRTAAIDEYRFAGALGTGLVGGPDVVGAWAAACTFGERPERVRLSAALAAPALRGATRRPAVVVADAVGVGVLGPRPRDPVDLAAWQEGRAALGRYLDAGHRLGHLADPRGASAATWLAVAQLEVDLAARRLGPLRDRAVARGHPRGRGLS